ncbi:SDR family NAD(P)-dependent oxidoreductase [Amycolatopsis sp. H20-H5]|uniref:SDR family NAD(P)-dependent oxidoreductase n=1 Tax=Amycolatopsis sp. H20-H5 TaxID=3046309 RepID=UPI002DB5704A|nr:SDR family NAD(P)-dependent oxidoreductase [Amycolatopsis sp. H20-H5]MEC3974259.1 SDR family NAD(P)-dependent oxidoreductase [Amycolatopsis sp. H20-H5]
MTGLDLTGKTALVTGGTRGIGRATALTLARHGATVTAVGAGPSAAAEKLADELKALSDKHTVAFADVSDPTEVAALAEQAGALDVVVNNAGVISSASVLDLELDEWHRVLDTNLTSMFLVVRSVLPRLRDNASIINITSAVAWVGMPDRAHYTAAKAGVHGLTRSLCKELGPRHIRVNSVAPGIVETDQVAGLTPEQRVRYAGLAALGRLGKPDDIADAVLFLAGDLAGFVNGALLYVDGGI